VQVYCRDPQPGGQTYSKTIWHLSDWVFEIYRTEYKVKPPAYLGVYGEDQLDTSPLAPVMQAKWCEESEYLRKYFEWEKGLKRSA